MSTKREFQRRRDEPDLNPDFTLPWDEDAERAVIGAILLEPMTIETALEILRPEDFHRPAHHFIYEALLELYRQGKGIDPLTLVAELERTGKLERANGRTYVASLIDGLPRTSNIGTYSGIVSDRSLLRQMLGAFEGVRQRIQEGDGSAAEILEAAEAELYRLSDKGRRGGFVPIKDVADLTIAEVEEMAERRELITGLTTGYTKLDKMTSGLQKSDLVILAARPSMGKTALALNIARNAAIHGATVGVFSLEMSSKQLFQRLLAGEALVELQKIRTGTLEHEEWDRVGAAYDRLTGCRFFIDDSPGIGPMAIRSKARRLKSTHNLGLIVVDYLQLMKLEGRVESRQAEVSEISRALKAIAKELEVPVVALSQLSRQPESGRGSDHRPQLSDLRESGAIEQDADLVMFIYRPEVYEKDETKKKDLEGQAELIIAKQRNGPTGTVPLVFVKQFTRFETTAEFDPF